MVRGLGFLFEVFWVYGLWVCGVGFRVNRFRVLELRGLWFRFFRA